VIKSRQKHGLLLVGHGTRNQDGQAEFLQVAQAISELRPEWAIEPCFLELATPSIDQGLARLMEHKIEALTVAPLLLFAAGHAKRDIPQAVGQALTPYGPLKHRQTGPLGCHEAILELSARRYREAVAELEPVPPEKTILLMVGRGSRDETASAEMRRFANLRAARTPVARVETCFYAMARPSLEETLPRLADLGYRRVVVQPHLLFEGELLAAMRERVDQMAHSQGAQQWVVTAPLGPAPNVARALVDRAESTLVTSS